MHGNTWVFIEWRGAEASLEKSIQHLRVMQRCNMYNGIPCAHTSICLIYSDFVASTQQGVMISSLSDWSHGCMLQPTGHDCSDTSCAHKLYIMSSSYTCNLLAATTDMHSTTFQYLTPTDRQQSMPRPCLDPGRLFPCKRDRWPGG